MALWQLIPTGSRPHQLIAITVAISAGQHNSGKIWNVATNDFSFVKANFTTDLFGSRSAKKNKQKLFD